MTRLSLDSTPRRADGIIVRRERDDLAVLTRPTGPAYEVNDTALALWELCDGSTRVEEMVDAASELFAAPRQSLERDVLLALDELASDGLIAPESDPA